MAEMNGVKKIEFTYLSVKREGIETKAITQISELCNVS
jgi:hypothetical protein